MHTLLFKAKSQTVVFISLCFEQLHVLTGDALLYVLLFTFHCFTKPSLPPVKNIDSYGLNGLGPPVNENKGPACSLKALEGSKC